MSHYEEIVAEYLCSELTRFVNPGFNLDLGGVGPHGKGRNWWIDVLAVDFKSQTIYLCEATFAEQPSYMLRRLRAWASDWAEIRENLYRLSGVPSTWQVMPWIFTPDHLKQKIDAGIAGIANRPFDHRWTAFEEIVPWRRPQRSRIAALKQHAVSAAEKSGGAADAG